MNANAQAKQTQQPNQQKGQPDIRSQNPDANKQVFAKTGSDTQSKQQPSARPQNQDEEMGSSCSTSKDSCSTSKDPSSNKKTGTHN